MIDLVQVKKDMLHYVQGVRAVRGMRRGLSDHHIVLCQVRLEIGNCSGNGKANGGKVENSKRTKDGNGRLALKETEVRRIWKKYF